jgi:2,4-dienoyl-CoA reductase-like NADH-dependent reductase (Old Yellow Enzyme family)
MAAGGRPTERLRLYHAAKARGGCALTIVGGSSSVHPSPAAAWKQIANHDDTIISAYRSIADAVHRHDCLVFTQLTHLGRRAVRSGEVLTAIRRRVGRDFVVGAIARRLAVLDGIRAARAI